ncbi:MAG: hypothetical protein AAGC97_13590 [Planctomycetota bacterium]
MSTETELTNPYSPSVATGTLDSNVAMHREYPGIGRAMYVIGGFAVGLVQNLIGEGVAAGDNAEIAGVAALVVTLVAAIAQLVLAYHRLINIGSNGWWCLGMIVPLLNLFIVIRCLICPAGYADHKTLDTAGKVMTGIAILLVVLVVGLVVFVGMSA